MADEMEEQPLIIPESHPIINQNINLFELAVARHLYTSAQSLQNTLNQTTELNNEIIDEAEELCNGSDEIIIEPTNILSINLQYDDFNPSDAFQVPISLIQKIEQGYLPAYFQLTNDIYSESEIAIVFNFFKKLKIILEKQIKYKQFYIDEIDKDGLWYPKELCVR